MNSLPECDEAVDVGVVEEASLGIKFRALMYRGQEEGPYNKGSKADQLSSPIVPLAQLTQL